LIDLLDASAGSLTNLEADCAALADVLIGELRAELTPALAAMETNLAPEHRDVVRREYARWAATDTWQLINAADPCGT
jgi:hypothetical protein